MLRETDIDALAPVHATDVPRNARDAETLTRMGRCITPRRLGGNHDPIALKARQYRLAVVELHVRRTRAWLPGPFFGKKCRRKFSGRTQYRTRAIELAEFHRIVVDDWRALGRAGRIGFVVRPRERLIVPQPSNRPTFYVIRIEELPTRTAGKDRSELPRQIVERRSPKGPKWGAFRPSGTSATCCHEVAVR